MNSSKHQRSLYKIVIAHYSIGAVFFLILSIMFFFSIEVMSGHYFQPMLLALTHTAALGWGTMVIFGALNQLLPVILEKELFSIRMGWWSLLFLVPGIILLVYSFWVFEPGLYMQIGSVLILIGVFLFVLNVLFTITKGKQASSVFAEFILTSCLWLFLTISLGVLMVFNFQYPFLPKEHLQFLRLHAQMGISGWFLLLIIGVSAKLIPMFLLSSYQKTNLLTVSYYLINGALITFLIDGYLHGLNFNTYFILGLGTSGIGFYFAFLYQCIISRIRKGIDKPMVQSLSSFILLGIGILVLPVILYYHIQNDAYAVQLSVLYGTFIFMGWVSTLILGQTFKTLPYIIWVKHYEQLTGKFKIPLPADLINNRLLSVQLIAFFIFLVSFLVGFLLRISVLKYLGAVSLIMCSTSYCLHVFLLLIHKTRTEKYDRI